MENLDRIGPEIDDLRRLYKHMSTYRQFQLQQTALTDKTEAVAAATRITISKELNKLPGIQDRTMKCWEHLFHLPFKAGTPRFPSQAETPQDYKDQDEIASVIKEKSPQASAETSRLLKTIKLQFHINQDSASMKLLIGNVLRESEWRRFK
ncbi:hypothetical protein CBS147332_1355 [Penicillium roqueforti]|nr:hypothetical protein CBS147332_1355 [Penicillium roqueforti]KAI3122916.1 hypothetical protein CBS147331_1366 [Penicillium roqueforti]